MQEARSKIIENKEEKKRKLVDAAFELFTDKGFKSTSIQEIVDKADVAKGTFYLYFKDKYDLQEYLITKKSEELFLASIKYVDDKKITDFVERFINMIDFIIDAFVKDKTLLNFISKNLSLGVFGDRLSNIDQSLKLKEVFEKGVRENNLSVKNPELTLFMIVELTSSVAFTSILSNKPLPIDEIKPFLFDKIRKILLD